MRRVLLIFLSLVLALVGWSTVGAEDGFYVIPAMRGNYAPVPKTGQTTSYDIPDHRDDGALLRGVAWPTPRFTDNGNGTVTDKLTGLIWMQDANILGKKTWTTALATANTLASGSGGLTDGSVAGDWRLPNRKELESLVDCSTAEPALPPGHPFTNVQSLYYVSSSTNADSTTYSWGVVFSTGLVASGSKSTIYNVWCVRGGP